METALSSSCDLEVDFGSREHADIAYAALVVDKELQPDKYVIARQSNRKKKSKETPNDG